MKKIYYAAVLILMFISISFANAADINEGDVKTFIANMGTESQDILNDSKATASQREVNYRKFTENIVDSNWVARFILGNYWRELTPEQRTEFQSLYKEYLLENYMPKLKNYNKELKVKEIKKQRDTVYMVYTTTKDTNNRDMAVDFRVIEKNGSLYITDIIPEGISFIGSQRSDVGSAISQNGYDKFIKDLKQKVGK